MVRYPVAACHVEIVLVSGLCNHYPAVLLGFNLAYVLRGVNPFYRVSSPSHYLALIQRSLPARPRLAPQRLPVIEL